MADPNPTDCAQRGPQAPAAADRKVERAVLAFLLDQHPAQLTILDLSRVLNAERDSGFEGDDAVERAVRELNCVGLLDCGRGMAVPTRAALHFAWLEED